MRKEHDPDIASLFGFISKSSSGVPERENTIRDVVLIFLEIVLLLPGTPLISAKEDHQILKKGRDPDIASFFLFH